MNVRDLVVLNDYCHPCGGASRVAIDSTLGLNAAGIRVHFFGVVGPVDPDLKSSGVNVICLNGYDLLGSPNRLKSACDGIWNFSVSDRLKDLLRNLDSETTLVSVHSWSMALSSSVIHVIQQAGFRSVWTLHDFVTLCPTGSFFHHGHKDICNRVPLGIDCLTAGCDSRSYLHKIWRIGRHLAAKQFSCIPEGCKNVIYLSELSRKVMEGLYPSTTSWHFVRNPVRILRMAKVTPSKASGFIFVGRLVKEKGVELFARAAFQAAVPATIIGDGYLARPLARNFPSIPQLGWSSKSTVIDAIRSNRCLVFPSLWHETFGLTVYESLAQGVPVIVSDGCAAADAVTSERNGLTFRTGNLDSLVESMLRILDNDFVDRLGAASYDDYWSDPPTLESHVADLLRVFERIS